MPDVGERFNPRQIFSLAWIPPAVFYDTHLSPTAKLCYGRLAVFCGEKPYCWPSQETLAKELNVSERTARDCISQLEERGHIRGEQVGMRRTNRYWLVWTDSLDSSLAEGTEDSEPPEPQMGEPANSAGCDRKFSAGQDRKFSAGQDRKFSAGPIGISSDELVHREEDKAGQEGRPEKSSPTKPRSENTTLEDNYASAEISEEIDPADIDRQALYANRQSERAKKIRKEQTQRAKAARKAAAFNPNSTSARLQQMRAAAQDGSGAQKEPAGCVNLTGEVSAHPPIQPAAPESQSGLPYAALEWNKTVTGGPPVEQWTRYDRDLQVDNPDFIAALPKVLALCQKAFEVHSDEVEWLNFRYLLRQKNGDAPNWYRMANGEFNWIKRKRAPSGRRTQADIDKEWEDGRGTYAALMKRIADESKGVKR